MNIFRMQTGHEKCLFASQNIPLKIIIVLEKIKLLWCVSYKMAVWYVSYKMGGKINLCCAFPKRKRCVFVYSPREKDLTSWVLKIPTILPEVSVTATCKKHPNEFCNRIFV